MTIRKAASDSPFAQSCLLPEFDAVIQGPENFPLWQWPLKATQNGQTRNSEQAGESVLPPCNQDITRERVKQCLQAGSTSPSPWDCWTPLYMTPLSAPRASLCHHGKEPHARFLQPRQRLGIFDCVEQESIQAHLIKKEIYWEDLGKLTDQRKN